MLTISPLADSAADTLAHVVSLAPYLKRLAEQSPELVRTIETDGARAVFEIACEMALAAGKAATIDEAMARLRDAKRAAHLSIAVGDLSGRWTLDDVTGAMTDFADIAVQSALDVALANRGLKAQGLFIIALGKMGARELNYSSDIDLAAFYDIDVFDGGARSPGDAASRVLKDVVRILEERTSDGYVFRTDLRLRPDPRSTPLAVSTQMAETYYESVGQNWERMVWIKARACAGDLDIAEQFITLMQPFVWRRHLDYWAIGDIHSIKRMINAAKGDPSLADPATDVKLGPGGIREIEFFTQTQQLILGGRNTGLRERATLVALDALVSAGTVEAEIAASMQASYSILRAIEHRIQMRNDEQTHALPRDPDVRAQVAALCGYQSLEAFDAELISLRRQVHRNYRDLFADEEGEGDKLPAGNLIFTGVDDDPGTVATLSEMGFEYPSRIIETIRQWHRGNAPATRTPRGRQLLTGLLPALLQAMSDTGEADTAFARFSDFFSHLSAGVQTLSMLQAERGLMADLVATLALAPRLSKTLGRRPDLLETLVGGSTLHTLVVEGEQAFDEAMDGARRYHREQSFLIGHQLLHGRLEARLAGEAYSDLADECLQAMANTAEAEMQRRLGPAPGRWCVAALGKLGGREMTATSDLDLIVIYEPDTSDAPQAWFSKFTQRLITALSAQTSEGRLYEVDMRLRPSGNAGPIAVRLSAFERYQRDEAWTWEHMALTRLRPLAGDQALQDKLLESCRAILSVTREPPDLKKDVHDMRLRLHRERPGQGLWDMKMAEGGLIDLEFIIQHVLLLRGGPEAHQPNMGEAITSLAGSGQLEPEEAQTLRDAHGHMQTLQQVLRLAAGDDFDPETASQGLKSCLIRAVGADSFDGVATRLESLKKSVADIRLKKIGSLATENKT